MYKKLCTLMLVAVCGLSISYAQRVQIGNVFYTLSSDHTAGVTFESRDSAANYASATYINVQPQVIYQGVRYTVTHVEPRAFANSTTLQTVNLPASVTSIHDEAFAYCTALQSVNLPVNLSHIGYMAFYGCSALSSIRIPNGITNLWDYVFADCSSLRSVILPAKLTEIRPFAFANCAQLASISLPSTLTTIHSSAFTNCTALQAVAVPDKVEYIGESAYTGCTSLSNVRLPNSLMDVGEGIFKDCKSLIRPVFTNRLFIYMPPTHQGYYAIPNGIEVIIEGAFSGCSGLTNIKIPASVKSIDSEEFEDCTSLPVYGGIRYADTYLVEVTDKYLPSYTVRQGTRWIAEEAFSWLNHMTTVTLPASLTFIGEDAFLQCRNLSAIYNYAAKPQDIGYDVFAGQSEWIDYELFGPVDKNTCVLYVPAGSVDLYRASAVWGEFVHIVAISGPEGIDEINDESRKTHHKVINDGQLLIRQGGRTYNLTGTQVQP